VRAFGAAAEPDEVDGEPVLREELAAVLVEEARP
jgi:hypothetical protein